MKRITFVFLIVLIVLAAFLTVKNRTKKEEKNELAPKLVVGIVVDQMRYDFLYRYWDQYSEGGFKRLVNEGFSCENHHYSYSITNTAPGHASIYSGTTPSVHGIIANDWWMKDEKRSTYCVEDLSVNPVGIDDLNERRSPRNIFVTNLSDEIKINSSYKSKVIGVSMKDRGAVLPAGKLADAAYWYTGKEGGKFVSSSYYMDELPEWVNRFNDSTLVSEILEKGWYPLYDTSNYWQSNPDNSVYEGTNKGMFDAPVFPYDMLKISERMGNANVIKETPFVDVLVKKMAMMALDEEELGKDEFCDVLCISFSGPDYVGHNFGPRSMEIQDTYLRLDLLLQDIIIELDEKVGAENYTLFLSSDHAVSLSTQELIDHKVNVDYFDNKGFKKYVDEVLTAKFGLEKILENISNDQIFLNESLLIENNISIEDVEDFLAYEIMQFDGVFMSATATSLREAAFVDYRLMLQKSYNQKRSGNVLYTVNPGWKRFYKLTGAEHGSLYAYDTQVPLLFYGWGIPHGKTTRRTLVEDIAPTITSLLHVQNPMGTTGNPVWEIK
jgi:predicted AlkP superfamily pyrophosphatase or phosphodiesterase